MRLNHVASGHACTLGPVATVAASRSAHLYRRLLPSFAATSCFTLPGMGALALMNLGSAVVRQYPPPAAGKVAAALSSAAGNPAPAVAMLQQVGVASLPAAMMGGSI